MKKLVILFLVSFAAVAQTQKGSLSLGTGSINFTSYLKSSDYEGTSIRVSPSVGYLVLNNLELGLGLNSEFSWSKSGNSQDVFLSPYVTKYFGRGRFQPFVKGKSGIGNNSGDYNFLWELSAGGLYFFTKHVAVGLNVGYLSSSQVFKKDELKAPPYKEIYSGINFNFYLPLKKEKSSEIK